MLANNSNSIFIDHIKVAHIFRKGNYVADALAGKVHDLSFGIHLFES